MQKRGEFCSRLLRHVETFLGLGLGATICQTARTPQSGSICFGSRRVAQRGASLRGPFWSRHSPCYGPESSQAADSSDAPPRSGRARSPPKPVSTRRAPLYPTHVPAQPRATSKVENRKVPAAASWLASRPPGRRPPGGGLLARELSAAARAAFYAV